MSLFNLDVNKCSPKIGDSITPNTSIFTFETSGNETFNYSLQKLYKKPTALTGDPSYAYSNDWTVFDTWLAGEQTTPLPDKQTVQINSTYNGTEYVGYECGYRIMAYGYPFNGLFFTTYRAYLGGYLGGDSEELKWRLESFRTGDLMCVCNYGEEESPGSFEYYYVHRFAEYGSVVANVASAVSFYTNRGDAMAGYDAPAVKFTTGKRIIARRVVRTPIITLNLILAKPNIALQTVYDTQSLTYDTESETYVCVNSNIDMKFTLTGINTDIYKYRILLYDDQYGDSSMKPTSTGEWIYNMDMHYNVSNQLNGSNIYLAIEAYDTLNTKYRTILSQKSPTTWQYALHIRFDYTGLYPSLPTVPEVTYDACNGCDIISWQSAVLLYGGVYPMNDSHQYVGYSRVTNFILTGNNAINLENGYTLTYPRYDSYHNPSKLQITEPSSAPIFLWQPSADGFEGLVVSYTDGDTTISVYIENGRIIRRCTSSNSIYNGLEIDDGAITIESGTVYLVGITDSRAIFRIYRKLNVVHNVLDFDLSDGNNIL